jgi:hypothetical protein
MSHASRPLYRILLETDKKQEAELNRFLEETLRLNDNKRNDAAFRMPQQVIDATKLAMASSVREFKVYMLLIWMENHPAILKYLTANAEPVKLAIFRNKLKAGLEMHLMGLRPDGSFYPPGDNLQMARVGVFVQKMMREFLA